MSELLLVSLAIAPSEAVCETYGSIMEHYQQRFTNTGTTNDDIRLQKEMMVKLNGPKVGRARPFVAKIAAMLAVRPTVAYLTVPVATHKRIMSVVVSRLNREEDTTFRF